MDIKDIVGFDEVFEAVCEEWTELRLNVRKVDGQTIASIGAHNELAIKTAPRDQSAGSVVRDAIQDLANKIQANDDAVIEEPVTVDPVPWTGGPVGATVPEEATPSIYVTAEEKRERWMDISRQARTIRSQIEILSNRLNDVPDRFEQTMGELRARRTRLEELVEEEGILIEEIRDLDSGADNL